MPRSLFCGAFSTHSHAPTPPARLGIAARPYTNHTKSRAQALGKRLNRPPLAEKHFEDGFAKPKAIA
jgi:hypothetical protein